MDPGAGFYSAQEDPTSAPKSTVAVPKKAGPKKVTNPVLMEQLTSLASQMQFLAARQDALEKRGADRDVAVGDASGLSSGKPGKLPAVSDGLASVGGPPISVAKGLSLVGPPRTKMTQMQLSQALAQAPEDPNEVLVGGDGAGQGVIVNALSQQSTALASLVAHLVGHSNDPLMDLQSGLSGSSSMKGVQRREKLQAELASRSGNFFLLLMQQIHKRLHPGRVLPKTESETGAVSFLEYLEKSGGYRNQKTLGLVQWILAHAIDAAAQGDFQGTKEIIALLAMAVEQANFDNGDWSVAYLISLMEEPPIQLFQKRSAAITSTGRPFSPLMPPVWTATTLSYIKDMEVLANKKPEGKAKAAPSNKQEGTGSPAGSPKRKPRFPKRPEAAQEGTQ